MADLYADENFPLQVLTELGKLGHDVLTAQQHGRAQKKVPDPQVLAEAIRLGRAVLTLNRWHFVKLHRTTPSHAGIIVCTRDDDIPAFVQRIHQAILAEEPLAGKLVRVNKPAKP
jgi:predicted nuclease of predicted toxin-antitoxin system